MIETEKGICRLCLVPVMCEPSFHSLQLSELLFGEHYEVLEASEDKKWIKVKIHFDGVVGWILKVHFYGITQEYFEQINHSDYKVCTDLTANIFFKKHYLNILIGSVLPISTNELFKIEEQLAFNGNSKSLGQRRDYGFLREILQKYMYSPYRAGARSPYGIDDIGLVQQVYRMVGYPVPRSLKQLAATGDQVDSWSESRPGDLLVWSVKDEVKAGINIGEEQAVIVTDSVKIVNIDDKGLTSEMREGQLVAVRRILKM
ncbi:MAG: NlpC/P60 family protein [Imperialibacter sp.]|uniref:C40 family peptidase n=1 Tax=Imperialibacter sp. TaxID=2038411 RepID=UPI0032ED845C